MKKITLLTVFVFSVVAFTNAQIALGVKGGLNFASTSLESDLASAEDNLGSDNRTGYHFGAFAEIGLGGIALQPELLFSTKGNDLTDLSYIEVPVLFKKNFLKVLNIHVGPQFGFLTNAESDDQDVNFSLAASDEELKDWMESSEVSVVLGAGVNLPFGLTGGLRYVYGLNDVWENDDIAGLGDTEIKNRTFQLYVGWKFAGN